MSKIKLLSIVTVLMLLCNIVLMYAIWDEKKRQHHPPGIAGEEGPRNEIIERLKFDDAQVKQYDAYIREHRVAMNRLDEKMHLLKKELYTTLLSNNVTTKQDSLINLIANTQQEAEHVNLNHFQKIGSICTPAQKPAFEALVNELSDLFMPKRKPHREF